MRKIKNFGEACIFKINKFSDNRGYFYTNFIENKLKINYKFVQKNLSFSKKNVFRGMHMQNSPYEQGKLVHVIDGEIIDYFIDYRVESKFFKKLYSIKVSSKNPVIIWIPPGYAHGFLVKSKKAIVEYMVTKPWSKKDEITINCFDKEIGIKFFKKPILSKKDLNGVTFNEAILKFKKQIF
jgi:dTDP-4-dehydrorhamnose 3,5-epimerase